MSEPVTGVWFDLDGTLVTYDRSFATIFQRATECESSHIHDTFTTALFQAIAEGESTPYRDAFDTVVKNTELSGSPRELAAAYVDAEIAASQIVEGGHAVLERLSQRGPVGVVTNGAGPVQRQKLVTHGLVDRLDSVVVSGEVGVAKPDSQLFQEAATTLPATEHIYICDSPAGDIPGAHMAGWSTILVIPAGDDSASGEIPEPTEQVTDIRNIPASLEDIDRS